MKNPIKTGTEQPQDIHAVEKLEEEWNVGNDAFDLVRHIKLTATESEDLRTVREFAINIAALIEKELLRRGEEF